MSERQSCANKETFALYAESILSLYPRDHAVSITITRKPAHQQVLCGESYAVTATGWKERFSIELTEPKEKTPPSTGSKGSLSTGNCIPPTKQDSSTLNMEWSDARKKHLGRELIVESDV